MRSRTKIFLIVFAFGFMVLLTIFAWVISHPKFGGFDENRAYQDVVYQISLGSRVPGTVAHQKEVKWITSQVNSSGWETEVQSINDQGIQIQNIIAKRGNDKPWIILGAHYDSRQFADNDPNPSQQNNPVPGANDGASGVAVLLEIAHDLPHDVPYQIWLVFFDWEDQGRINNQDWILGSRAFVDSLKQLPDSAIIVDMIGDKDLNIYLEKNSDPSISQEIWNVARNLGYQNSFILQEKYSMLDDHTPFLEKGVKAVDIIDFDYPFWHTTQDTPDKTSAKSLGIVGNTLLNWLEKQ